MGRWNVANCFSKVESGVYRCTYIPSVRAHVILYTYTLHTPLGVFTPSHSSTARFVSSPRARLRPSSPPPFTPRQSLTRRRDEGVRRRLVTFPSRLLFLSYTHVHVRARGSYADHRHTRALMYTRQVAACAYHRAPRFLPFCPRCYITFSEQQGVRSVSLHINEKICDFPPSSSSSNGDGGGGGSRRTCEKRKSRKKKREISHRCWILCLFSRPCLSL